MALLVLAIFWVFVIKAWILSGPRVPLVFIALWLIGVFGFPLLGWNGYIFLAFEAMLAVLLVIKDQVESAL